MSEIEQAGPANWPYWEALGRRHEVIRSGEREEIPRYVRAAVYIRDGYTCCICGLWLKDLDKNLDHVIPWSAGGSNASTNLRTSCPPCNERRKNTYDGSEDRRRLPVTWWCTHCWTTHRHYPAHWSDDLGELGWRDMRAFVDPEMDDLTLAFCANCGGPGYTDKPL